MRFNTALNWRKIRFCEDTGIDIVSKMLRVGIRRKIKNGHINLTDVIGTSFESIEIRPYNKLLQTDEIDNFLYVESDVKSILDMLYDDMCKTCKIRDLCSRTTKMPCEELAFEAFLFNKDMSISE